MWYELGILWRVNWINDYSTTSSAEEFIAILQIILADLVDVDLCLIETEVDITIVCSDDISTPDLQIRDSIEKKNMGDFSPKKRIFRVAIQRKKLLLMY